MNTLLIQYSAPINDYITVNKVSSFVISDVLD